MAEDYRVTSEAVELALSGIDSDFEIVVKEAKSPDLDALSRAKLFVGSGFSPAFIGQHGQKLEIVHCTSAGVERYLPLDWLPQGASLTNSSGVHAEKGGAFGAMAVLMLNEGMPRHVSNQKTRRWDASLSKSIKSKTVLIYGFGSLGEAIAERLRPFGPRVVGIRRSGETHPFADLMLKPEQLWSVLPEVDILVVSCPLTSDTRNLFGAREFDLLPNGASVFNIARSAVMAS